MKLDCFLKSIGIVLGMAAIISLADARAQESGTAQTSQSTGIGSVKVRIVDSSKGDEPVAGRSFFFYRNGMDIHSVPSHTTDANGMNHIENVQCGQGIVYSVVVPIDNGSTAQPVTVTPGETVDLTVRIYESTTDMAGLTVSTMGSSYTLFSPPMMQGQTFIEVHDVYTIRYDGTKPLIGTIPFMDRPGHAVVVFPVPPQAWELFSPEEESGLSNALYGPTQMGVGVAGTLQPGESLTYRFRYFLPSQEINFERPVFYPTQSMKMVIQPSLSKQIEVEGLQDRGETDIPGAGRYRVYQAENLPSGNTVKVAVKAPVLLPMVVYIVLFLAISSGVVLWVVIAIRKRDRQRLGDENRGASSQTRLSQGKQQHQKSAAKKKSDIERLAETIARLDMKYESGEVEERDYYSERSRLKAKLAEAVGSRHGN